MGVNQRLILFATRFGSTLTRHSYNLLHNVSIRPLNYTVFVFTSILERLFQKAKTTGEKLLLCVVIFLSLLWISVISYASFYNFYLPTAEISRPVHLSFSVCPQGVGICSFPSSNVSLTENNPIKEVLGSGQVYYVIIDMDIPDTPVNRDLGMFMVVLRMYDRYYHVSATSHRAALFKYKSIPMRLFNLVVWSPLYFIGFYDEKQTISVEMFSTYTDDFYHPSVGATVEIQNHLVQIYTCQLKFYAKFTGLKYLLHYWPITSAICGIVFNFSFFALLFTVAVSNKRQAFVEMMQTVSQNNLPADVGRLSDKKRKKQALTADKRKLNRSTQTVREDLDVEPYILPLVQEPADFGDVLNDDDVDLIEELRQRRVQ